MTKSEETHIIYNEIISNPNLMIMEIKMKIRNIALTAVQFASTGVAVVATAPIMYVGLAATGVKVVAEIAQVVSFKAADEVVTQFTKLNNKLEELKVKEIEIEIVQSPVGDEAIAVN